MKKTKLIIYTMLSMVLASCSDYLDVVDLDEPELSNLFKTEADMEFALNHLYTVSLPEADLRGYMLPYFWTDDAIHRNVNTLGRLNSEFNWTPNSGNLARFYRYGAIADINFFLERLPDIEFSSETLKGRYDAEARFFRAMIYESMVLAYGDVPLLTKVIEPEDTPARTPRLEVFNFVLSELDAVIGQLPEVDEYDATDAGRITKGVALAIKARAYLNAIGWHPDVPAMYAGAEAACAAIINSGDYSLVDGIDGFAEQFTTASDLVSPETILSNIYVQEFKMHNLGRQVAPKGAWRGAQATFGNNQNRAGFSSDFIEEVQTINGLFPKDDPTYDPADPWINRDPRLQVTVILPGDRIPSKGNQNNDYIYQPHPNINPNGSADNINKPVNGTGYCFRKYLDFNLPSLGEGHADLKIIRYSEVLLMYAEALAGKGDNAGALMYLDMVRDRVGMPKYADIGLPTVTRGTTGNQTIDAILLERRYEFAGEGPQRWFDIWRYKLGAQVIKPVFGIPKSKTLPGDLAGPKFTVDNGNTYNRVWEDRYYLLPIRESTIDRNPNLDQNPGW
jgi:hypothetical protein